MHQTFKSNCTYAIFTLTFSRSLCDPVVGYDSSLMDIFSRDILAKIQTGTSGWEKMVPERAAAIIKERKLFDYNDSASPSMAG